MANMESETERNTRLNAAMFPSSSDSIQLYKNQNNSSDLLGRLYYDDFDSNDLVIPARTPNGATPTIVASSANGSGVTTPLLTPSQEKMGGPEYFSINPNGRPKSALVSSASSSSLDLPAMNASSNTSSNSARSGSARIKLDRGVSFDTVPQGSRKSYTIKSKHPQFRFRRNNKTWLFGFNNDAESTKALEWLFDGMIIHGDTLIILQVLDEKKVGSGTGTTAVTAGGIDKKQAAAHLQHFEELNVHQKKISIVFEVVTGKPEKCLKLAIEEYSPSMMVIGTHHYNPEKEHHRSLFGSSSISKHFLECALVPVIVVKPNYQYTEYLSKPIDSEDYFKNWMKNTELEHSHHTGSATINGDDAQLSASSASSAASQGSDKSSQGSRTKSFSRLLFGRHEH
ncbi:uncharacterized protein LODBEIA_P55900 [Lodderomyces beijingensis]|uniref:UspA domain-containing protein n=1 Tax=Lodderomyces beijingensis TaxID=1775926 RepID=A0ABP0ZTB0_9ASCO